MTQVFLEAMEGWLFELVRQLPVLAWLSSALLCLLNIRWTLWQLLFALSCEALFTLLADFVGPFDEVSRHFCATLTQKCAKTVPSSMKTIPITYRHGEDKQSPTSNARPCAPRSSAPVSPRHSRTNKVRPRTLGPARHGPPHQSLPDIPGQTKSDLERSALRATVLCTSLSPTSPDKQSPTSNARRCAPRYVPCSEYFPSNEGELVGYQVLVYTTQVNSVFRAIWLVPQSQDIKWYSPPCCFRRKTWRAKTMSSENKLCIWELLLNWCCIY